MLAESDRIAHAGARLAERPRHRGPWPVSVVGFDGVPEGAASDPPLTTIRQPAAAMGRRAVELIVERGEEVAREVMSVDLVVRGSTAPPPA